MLYHCSKTAGLTELVPHISSHGKPYVYAIKNRLTALLFGAPKNDFDFLLDEKDGKPVIYECYPDAFRKIYTARACTLYEVAEDGFISGMTGWQPELVSEHAVPVVKETHISDLFAELTQAIQNGELTVRSYTDDDEYKSFLRRELSSRVAFCGITEEQRQSDERFVLYHNELLENA